MKPDLDPEFLRIDSFLAESARIVATNMGLIGPERKSWHVSGLLRLLGRLKTNNPSIPMEEIARTVAPIFVEQTGRDESEVYEHAAWLEARPEGEKPKSGFSRGRYGFDRETCEEWEAKAPPEDRVLSRLSSALPGGTSGTFLNGYFKPEEKAVVIARYGDIRKYLIWPQDAERIDRISEKCSTTFHIQPILGDWKFNPRQKHNTLFAQEDVTSFRHTLIESDLKEFTGEAGTKRWLRVMAAACKWPVKAITTTGSEGPWGLHFHLVTPPLREPAQFELLQRDIIKTLVLAGADPNAISIVREARLPGRIRPPSPGKASGLQRTIHFDFNPVKPFNQLFL